MRRRISLLVAATTSAVIIAFLIPLGLLVRTLAEDRAVAGASQEARAVADLVAGVDNRTQLKNLVARVDQRSTRATSVVLPDGTVIGTAPDSAHAGAVSRARAGEAFTQFSDDGAEVLVPVITERGTIVVRTAVTSSDLRQGVTTAWLTFALLGAALMVVSVVGAGQLGRRVSAPVSELAAVAHRLRSGELEARAVPRGPSETVELGTALNRLADRIGELLTAEREAVADLSHRLRTPLTALRLDVGAVTDPELADRLRDHIGHLQRTVDSVVRDARRPVSSILGRSCDAASVVRDRVGFWSALAADQGRELSVSIPSDATWAAIDANELVDVVDALVDNVFAHTPDGTPFSVSLTRTGPSTDGGPAPRGGPSTSAPGNGSSTSAPGNGSSTSAPGNGPSTSAPGTGSSTDSGPAPRDGSSTGAPESGPELIRLEVADSGPGAAHADVVARGSSTGDSTGLGLDIVRRAAVAAGGDLLVDRSPSGGMLVVVTLGVSGG